MKPSPSPKPDKGPSGSKPTERSSMTIVRRNASITQALMLCVPRSIPSDRAPGIPAQESRTTGVQLLGELVGPGDGVPYEVLQLHGPAG